MRIQEPRLPHAALKAGDLDIFVCVFQSETILPEDTIHRVYDISLEVIFGREYLALWRVFFEKIVSFPAMEGCNRLALIELVQVEAPEGKLAYPLLVLLVLAIA